ncbi:MAG: hypothetical protein ACTSRZ_02810 [Promethearchaeota archaeon]
MISTFGLIVNDEIIYTSNEQDYPILEIVIFSNSLLKMLSKNKWRLHKIIITPINSSENEKILVHQKYYCDNNLDVLFCVKGKFSEGSRIGYELLSNFEEQITQLYPVDKLESIIQEKKNAFRQFCDEISSELEDKYKQRIVEEKNMHENFIEESAILYTGISCQGLPIVSKLFGINLIDTDLEYDEESLKSKIEYFETTISGQLATIHINAFIRAQININEIQIILDPEEKLYAFINFAPVGLNNQYILELFTMGNPYKSKDFIEKVKNTINNRFECLHKPFAGELKPYAKLKEFLSSLDLK